MSLGRNLSSLQNSVSTTLPRDSEGFFDRESPQADCLAFFKVNPGTAFPTPTECICPYCGHKDGPDHFFSQSQIEYARANTIRTVADAVGDDLEAMASRFPRGGLVSVTVRKGGRPLVHYHHRTLPTHLMCSECT